MTRAYFDVLVMNGVGSDSCAGEGGRSVHVGFCVAWGWVMNMMGLCENSVVQAFQ